MSETKQGARHNQGDSELVQTIHDHATALGATCETDAKTAPHYRQVKAITDAPNLRGDDQQACTNCKFFKWLSSQEIHNADGSSSYAPTRGICERHAFETSADYVCDDWAQITYEDFVADSEKALVMGGGAVKALGQGKVGGYLITFTPRGDYDLTRDRFDATTDFGAHTSTPIFYNHGFDNTLKTRTLGNGTLKADSIGVWIESQLELRDEYEKAIYELAEQNKLGWSSGTAAHVVEREPEGKGYHIKRWLLGLDASLTPTPAEPRNVAVSLKSLLQNETAERVTGAPQALAETSAARETRTELETKHNLQTTEQGASEMDEKALAQLSADMAEMKTAIAGLVPQEPKQEKPGIVAPNTKTVTELGFKDDEVKSFLHWVRTGDDKAYKAAMQGQTDSEGGYAVPDDFYNQVVGKRNETAVMRQAGAQVFSTGLDRVLIPTEGTAATKFVVTAEEGSYDENEPTLGQSVLTIHKLTKLIKISEELEMDAKANFQGWLAGVWGRALGLAENYYFCNVAATGSSTPQSVTYAATTTTAVASQTVTTAAELLTLIYAVPSAYSDKLVMFMRRSTLGAFRALTGNPFAFIPTPTGSGDQNSAGGLAGYIHNIPVYATDDLPAQAAANKPVVIFNPDFYVIGEREGMTVSRNPYLYQATGQIGLFARVRMGGVLTQAEAAYVLVSKT